MQRLTLITFLLFVGCDSNQRIPVDSPEVETSEKRITTDDPEIELVRGWIAENSDSGTWDEVRWYPPLQRGEEVRLFRMKYRTRSPSGGKVLFDHIFWLQNEKLEVLSKSDHSLYRRFWERPGPTPAEQLMRDLSSGEGMGENREDSAPLRPQF